jgi:hypothetical protein
MAGSSTTSADARARRLRSAAVITAGHTFVPDLRRGHYELATDVPPQHRLTAAFAELARAI